MIRSWHRTVGRTPWSAADAPVGFSSWMKLTWLAISGSRGTRADHGVRSTSSRALVALLCAALTLNAQSQSIAPERPRAPLVIRPYQGATVPPVRLSNSDRIRSLMRGGILYLTVQDAIALAIENDLNLEVARYGPLLAEWNLNRQRGGGALRGAGSGISQIGSVASGQGVSGIQRDPPALQKILLERGRDYRRLRGVKHVARRILF